jgi:glycosyltransferase involved in cell wall biosynthesis
MKKEQISVVVCVYNEAHHVEGLMKSFAGIKDIVFADDGSTDGTQELAKSLGARVVTRNKHKEIPTDEDIAKFKARFGWAPAFVSKPPPKKKKKMEKRLCTARGLSKY